MNDSSKDGRSPPPARRPATRVVTAGRDNGRVSLAVRDDGEGIDPSSVSHKACRIDGRANTSARAAADSSPRMNAAPKHNDIAERAIVTVLHRKTCAHE